MGETVMIRLIALDLDGTLLGPQGQIYEQSVAAIAKARAAGVRVVIATGRSIQEAAAYGRLAGCDALGVALGGAALVDGETGQCLRRWDLPRDSALAALDFCRANGLETMVFAGEEILTDPGSLRAMETRGFPSVCFYDVARPVSDPGAWAVEHDLPLTKIHGEWLEGELPLEGLRELPGTTLTTSKPRDFELVPQGVDKGRTLALLALMYGIPLCETAALGDSGNDLEMLACVGLPMAMGNACPQAKELARFITGGHDEPDSVARAIAAAMEGTAPWGCAPQ